ALTGLRTPRATAARYALTVRRSRRSLNPFMRYLVDPLALSRAYARGTAQGDLALATSSSYAFNLDYALVPGTSPPPGGGGIRLAPAAVRFRSGLAGDDGARLTYSFPVARVADSALAPALPRSRGWRHRRRVPSAGGIQQPASPRPGRRRGPQASRREAVRRQCRARQAARSPQQSGPLVRAHAAIELRSCAG